MITGDDRDLFERSLRHATGSGAGAELDAALADLGWHDALADDPRTATTLLFELQGASGTCSSALDRVLALHLGIDDDVAVVLPALGRTEPPGEGDEVRGLATALALKATHAAVGTRAGVVLVRTGDLALRPVGGIDPALGLVELSGRLDGESRPGAAWADAVAAGQRALASELIGASRTMLDQAREHALDRIQFGRPIGSFQAVRHRLAESLVAIEAAAAAADAAWEDGTPLFAAVAKAVAGRSARTVARHAQQVLAGIGFTTEHPLHLSVRRVHVLDRLLGDSRSLTRSMGDELLRSRRLPPLLPL